MSDIVSMRILILLCFVAAGILSLLLSPLAKAIAPRIGAMDIPRDDRRMHDRIVPRFGGFAIAASGSILILVIRFIIPIKFDLEIAEQGQLNLLIACVVGGTLIYFVGIFDDIKGLGAVVKLLLQLVCASVTFALGVRIPAFAMLGISFSDKSVTEILLSWVVTCLWIVVITNAVNLMDGMDGLAAGVAGIAVIFIAYAAYIHGQYVVALSMVAIAGSCAGFLPSNFFPAKIFMGDGGALWLGFMISSLSTIGPAKASTLVATLVPLLSLGVPVFDIIFAVLRRKVKGKGIFEADKGHLHHQLNLVGMGQRRSVLMIYGISATLGVAAVVFSRGLYIEALLLLMVASLFFIVLVWGWNKTGDR